MHIPLKRQELKHICADLLCPPIQPSAFSAKCNSSPNFNVRGLLVSDPSAPKRMFVCVTVGRIQDLEVMGIQESSFPGLLPALEKYPKTPKCFLKAV